MRIRPATHADKGGIVSVAMSRVGFHTERRVVANRVEQMVNRARKTPRENVLLVLAGDAGVAGFGFMHRAQRFDLFVDEGEAQWIVVYAAVRDRAGAGRWYVALLSAMRDAADAPMVVSAYAHEALQGGEGMEKLGRLYGRMGLRQVASAWEW